MVFLFIYDVYSCVSKMPSIKDTPNETMEQYVRRALVNVDRVTMSTCFSSVGGRPQQTIQQCHSKTPFHSNFTVRNV